jgi:hypothetical protein
MPIDSQCSECGKTLRVNDEFVGRKARCPVCGLVYIAGGGQIAPDPSTAETSYTPQSNAIDSANRQNPDSWSSLPTQKPLEKPSVALPVQYLPIDYTNATSVPPVSVQNAPVKYFVRTPNTMVYGPSDRQSVLDWIDQGRLDETCHIREESSEQWIGIAAWKFQTRKAQNPISNASGQTANLFGSVPVSTVQSVSYSQTGSGNVVLVLGMAGWLLCPTAIGSWVCSCLAIYFAKIELAKIRNGECPSKEKAIVLIGMWLGITNILAWVLGAIGLAITIIVSN